jgi:ADP-heptose:LPS heptosyltransferase
MHLLVIRTSSMGDVALTTPVIASIREQYPEIEVTLLTRPAFIPFYYGMPGLQVFPADFEKRHHGFIGIFRLFRDLDKKVRVDHIIDLHDVTRSKILRWFFRLSGVRATVIDKGRPEKKALIKGKRKVQLKHTVQKYFDVFARAGFPVMPVGGPFIIPPLEDFPKEAFIAGMLNIGVYDQPSGNDIKAS